jgi:hypothetical protein
MTVNVSNKISGPKIKLAIVIVGVLNCMLYISSISLNDPTSMNISFGSIEPTDQQEENGVKIIKDSMTSYNLVNNETEFIGPFSSTYTITGNSVSLTNSHGAIISVIQEDFNKSPTMGYVAAGNTSTTLTANSPSSSRPTLPNPFADPAAINQTISETVSNAIETLDRSDVSIIEIKCDFDMNIEDWKCIG